jgi:hypothetical protein
MIEVWDTDPTRRELPSPKAVSEDATKSRQPRVLRGERATLYHLGAFGYKRVEAREFVIELVKYAQYPSAVQCRFKRGRERNWREFVCDREPSLIVLAGWDHPEPASPFKAVAGGEQTRYLSCDPKWSTEFSSLLTRYLAETPRATVLADYRGHNPYLPLEGCADQEAAQ